MKEAAETEPLPFLHDKSFFNIALIFFLYDERTDIKKTAAAKNGRHP